MKHKACTVRCLVAVLGIAVTIAVFVYILGILASPFIDRAARDTAPGTRSVDSLKLLVVISRHGNLGVKYDYPRDPYPWNDSCYWPYAPGQLTPRGRSEMYSLGEKVRSLYSGFVPLIFYPEQVKASSIPSDEQLMSGEAFFAGLFPPIGFQVWNYDLNWQPTPIYSDSPDRSLDVLEGYCPKYNQETDQLMSTFFEEYKSTIDEINSDIFEATGYSVKDFNETLKMWNKVYSEEFEGYAPAKWIDDVYRYKLAGTISARNSLIYAGTKNITRLVAGELLDHILDKMEQRINSPLSSKTKLLFYSGKDSSIVALLNALGVSKNSTFPIVRAGSALVLELHQNTTEQFYVQVLYLHGFTLHLEPNLLSMKNCGDSCDFEKFTANTKLFTNVSFSNECMLN